MKNKLAISIVISIALFVVAFIGAPTLQSAKPLLVPNDAILVKPNTKQADLVMISDMYQNPSVNKSYWWPSHTLGIDRVWQEVPYRGKGVVIAHIGSMVDINNPDLIDSTWVNTKEIPNNKIDDDRNGYIDDVNGWNYIPLTACVTGAQDSAKCTDVKPNPHSQVFGSFVKEVERGTRYRSVLSAKPDNKYGIAGIAPESKVMSLVVNGSMSPDTNQYFDKREFIVTRAIDYAINNGAKIIVFETALFTPSTGLTGFIERALYKAYAAGLFIVVKESDFAVDKDRYKDFFGKELKHRHDGIPDEGTPQGYIPVINIDVNNRARDARKYVNIKYVGAPGISSFSIPANFIKTPENYRRYGTDKTLYEPAFSVWDSPSAFFTAGVIALMLEKNPALKVEEALNILQKSRTITTCQFPEYGFNDYVGQINAYEALKLVAPFNGQIPNCKPMTNISNNFDVNDDGIISSLDALVIINQLNSNKKLSCWKENFYDVNNDGAITPIDGLMVINKLNSR